MVSFLIKHVNLPLKHDLRYQKVIISPKSHKPNKVNSQLGEKLAQYLLISRQKSFPQLIVQIPCRKYDDNRFFIRSSQEFLHLLKGIQIFSFHCFGKISSKLRKRLEMLLLKKRFISEIGKLFPCGIDRENCTLIKGSKCFLKV